MRPALWIMLGLAGATSLAVPALAQRKAPYFMAIRAGEARMRTGPGRNYPSNWIYRRRQLPVKVVDSYGEWRKVEDPDGAQGWMLVNLLDDKRTGMITGSVAELRAGRGEGSALNWRAEPGVIGRISKCDGSWCWFDVNGRGGYVEQTRIWGTTPGEAVD